MRTRVMNQLHVVPLNEGLRRKKALWRATGRKELESIVLAPWASRRRQDLGADIVHGIITLKNASRERFECNRRRFCRQGADRSPTPSLLPSPADRGVDRLATMRKSVLLNS